MGKSINYIGSKANLLSFLETNISDVVKGDLSYMVFCDIFAGTGIVGAFFKEKVKKVISNDLEYYSYVLNRNSIKNTQDYKFYEKYIDELNSLHVKRGIIYENYALGSGSKRNYFSDENAMLIDAVRMQIEEWHTNDKIDEEGYFFLLASLLQSADRVANTASLYGAFLKRLKKTAQQRLVIQPAEYQVGTNINEVYNKDANELISEVEGDILYIDPPYNHRQYGANYHILNTIALYDDASFHGKTGVRDYVSSAYCKKSEVYESFEKLIRDARFKYIFVSYNNEAYMEQERIKNIMSKYGNYLLKKQEHQRFKSYKKYRASTEEHLHILIKDS